MKVRRIAQILGVAAVATVAVVMTWNQTETPLAEQGLIQSQTQTPPQDAAMHSTSNSPVPTFVGLAFVEVSPPSLIVPLIDRAINREFTGHTYLGASEMHLFLAEAGTTRVFYSRRDGSVTDRALRAAIWRQKVMVAQAMAEQSVCAEPIAHFSRSWNLRPEMSIDVVQESQGVESVDSRIGGVSLVPVSPREAFFALMQAPVTGNRFGSSLIGWDEQYFYAGDEWTPTVWCLRRELADLQQVQTVARTHIERLSEFFGNVEQYDIPVSADPRFPAMLEWKRARGSEITLFEESGQARK